MEDEEQENFEKNMELLKETLRRANKEERQKQKQISNRLTVIAERMTILLKEFEELIESSRRNKCPENTANQDNKQASEMSNEEFNKWIKQSNKYFERYFAWSSHSLETNTEKIRIVKEFIELITQFCIVETEEKWLLLSIALRSQPNLLKYLETSNGNE